MRPRASTADRRVWVVNGMRTPFSAQGGTLADTSAAELGALALRETLLRAGVRPSEVQQVIVGAAFSTGEHTNLAREVALRGGLPGTVSAYAVSCACVSFLRAFADAALQIESGRTDVAAVVGVESFSGRALTLPRLSRALSDAGRARDLKSRIGAFRDLRARDLVPVSDSWSEHISGESLGASAERLAKAMSIGRDEQDAFAHTSHVRALSAQESGLLKSRICGVPMTEREAPTVVSRDDGPQEMTLSGLGRARPAYDATRGSVTAGNSALAADGAAAVLLTSDAYARSRGLSGQATLRALAFRALDPGAEPLMAPVAAVADVLSTTGLNLQGLGVIEMHEPYAVSVLANLRGLADAAVCSRLGVRPHAEIDPGRVNQRGGSIAFGHPLGATGGRIMLAMLDQLGAAEHEAALVCSGGAGGQGAAMVFEPC